MYPICTDHSQFYQKADEICRKNSTVDRSLYQKYGVKRGLRDEMATAC